MGGGCAYRSVFEEEEKGGGGWQTPTPLFCLEVAHKEVDVFAILHGIGTLYMHCVGVVLCIGLSSVWLQKWQKSQVDKRQQRWQGLQSHA